MVAKRITIRVSPTLHQQLRQAAVNRSVSLNTLAVRALETYVQAPGRGQTCPADGDRLPLQELSDLLAPAAESIALTEEELLAHARQVRRRIWQERYEQTLRDRVVQGLGGEDIAQQETP